MRKIEYSRSPTFRLEGSTMPQVNQQILGLGGGGDTPEQTRALLAHAISLTGKERPRVAFVPAAMGDADAPIVAFYERCAGLGELTHLKFHPWPPAGLRELALQQDAIFVGGGSRTCSPSGASTASTESCARRGRRASSSSVGARG